MGVLDRATKKRIGYLFVLLVLLVFTVINLSFTHPMSSDLFERGRVTSFMAETGWLPTGNLAYTTQDYPYVYPLGFDALVAILVVLSGSTIPITWQILSISLALILFVLGSRFSEYFLNDKWFAFLAGLFMVFTPRVLRLIAVPLPETLGLMLSLATLYLLLKKKYFPASFMASLLLLTHFRSSINFAIVLGLFLLFSIPKKNRMLSFKDTFNFLAIPTVIGLFWWGPKLSFLLNIQAIENPLVFGYTLFSVLGYAIIFSLLILPIAFKTNPQKVIAAWFSVYFAILLYSLYSELPMLALRQLTFAFIPAGILAAMFFKHASKHYFLRPLISMFFLFIVVAGLTYGLGFQSPITNAEILATKHLDRLPGENVMSGFISGYYIPAITSKRIVIGAFLEGIPDSNQRLQDTISFLQSEDEAEFKSILNKYEIDAVFLSRYELNGAYTTYLSKDKFSTQGFSKVLDSKKAEIYTVN
ncbi:MAG: hypothetical protein GOV15_01105 [Candidatus Diapherotrites archaeon]|nr:hypothetical protein [Candidatus Diapherotrites archaeon]